MSKQYKCLYNHEMLINFTSQTPYQSYNDEVGKKQFEGYVKELAGTQVDALICCPTAWRLPTYYSEINPVWQTWAKKHKDPNPVADWKYFDKTFHRVKEYMLRDDYEDAVQLTLEKSREIGVDFFFSYRMNDLHYSYFVDKRISPTMDPLWRNHPEMRFSTENDHYGMNYICREVRDWYFAVIEELVENYDIDGFELDFMRWPVLFPKEKLNEGTMHITRFVQKVRDMLNKVGRARGKLLKLMARVPPSLGKCLSAGLDIPAWQSEELLDMINVSSFYRISPEIQIEEFKKISKAANVYAELHFVTYPGKSDFNINRITSPEIYKTMAASFLGRGADGISLFNFAYVRDHHFNEARRRPYMNVEPPFEVLRNIVDKDQQKARAIHYVITPGFDTLPVKIPSKKALDFQFFLAWEPNSKTYSESLLRLEISRPGYLYGGLRAYIGNVELQQIPNSGELFRPYSNEALPQPECLFYFSVPVEKLRRGWNKITIETLIHDEYFSLCLKKYQLEGVELAVYVRE